jgi:hypothetical protein
VNTPQAVLTDFRGCGGPPHVARLSGFFTMSRKFDEKLPGIVNTPLEVSMDFRGGATRPRQLESVAFSQWRHEW